MKPEIPPDYRETVIVCACGATYKTRSTRQNIKLGICAACHPFFTGEQKFVDTAGRVDKFKQRYGTVRVASAAALKNWKAKFPRLASSKMPRMPGRCCASTVPQKNCSNPGKSSPARAAS